MPRFEFDSPAPASLYVEIGRGEVQVTCADVSATTVVVEGRDADRVDVHDRDGQVSVVAPRGGLLSAFDSPLAVTVTAPLHSNVATKLGSAEVGVDGPAGAVRLRTGSGEVRLESLSAPSTIDSGSGDVRVGRAGADLKVRTGSGDVVVDDAAAEVSVSTGSGDVRVASAGAGVLAKTGSGDLHVGAASGDVAFTSGSGTLDVGSGSPAASTPRSPVPGAPPRVRTTSRSAPPPSAATSPSSSSDPPPHAEPAYQYAGSTRQEPAMLDHPSVLEAEARARRTDRLVRSQAPRLPRVTRRHRLASGLRRVADRLDD